MLRSLLPTMNFQNGLLLFLLGLLAVAPILHVRIVRSQARIGRASDAVLALYAACVALLLGTLVALAIGYLIGYAPLW